MITAYSVHFIRIVAAIAAAVVSIVAAAAIC